MTLDDLSTPVILGCDFLMRNNVVIDFGKATAYYTSDPGFQLKLHAATATSSNNLTLDEDLPDLQQRSYDIPTDVHHDLNHVILDHKMLFSTKLGKTNVTNHAIYTGSLLRSLLDQSLSNMLRRLTVSFEKWYMKA